MGLKRCLIVVAIITIALSYLLYEPFPSVVEQPWSALAYLSFIGTPIQVGRFGELLGLGNWGKLSREIQDFLARHFLSPAIPDSLTVTDAVFDGVVVRIYQPSTAKNELSGAVIYLHGGGFVWGSIDVYQGLTMALATRTGLPVVSVNYRLSPEFKHPIPLDDCEAAVTYFITHAEQYGVDPKRIVIAGDSAGGNLAAAVTLRLSSKNFPLPPIAQVLIYPTLQALEFQLPAHLQNTIFVNMDGLLVHFCAYLGLEEDLIPAVLANNHTSAATKAKYANVFDVTSILPEKYRSSEYRKPVHEGTPDVVRRVQDKVLDPFFSPLVAPDELVRGLPSAYILTAGLDGLRDDGFLYAHRLRKQGVDVEHVDYPEAYHAFQMQIDGPFTTRLADRALDDIVRYVKQTVKSGLQ